MSHGKYSPSRSTEEVISPGHSGGSRIRKGTPIPGGIFSVLVFIAEAVFMFFLVKSGMMPTKYCLAIAGVLLVLVIVIYLMTRDPRSRGPFVAGILIGLLVVGVMVYGIIAFQRISTTLEKITTVRVETSQVSIYVLTEDPAESLAELTDDTFGILAELDRTSTDGAIEMMESELDTTVTVAEYDGITHLVDALYAGECRSIIMNQAYVDVLEDLDDYSDIADRIREVSVLQVELTIEVEVEQTEDGTLVEVTTAELGEAFVLYVSGIDSRTGLTARGRSDVNILAVVNTNTHQVLLVSTPRDYYVSLSISNGAKDKLTHAGIYGVQVSMDTLGMLYDVDIDYYFKVCFDGVVGVVDALGGVSVYSDYAFTAKHGGYSFSVGYNDVTGEEALGFVRERYSFSSGDRQRGKNQMYLIKAIVNKALSPSILVNYASILSSVEDCFDTNLTTEMITNLVNQQLDTAASWEIITYSVDGSDGKAIPYSSSSYAYVMIPDESTVATAKELIQAVLSDEVITQP